MNTKQIAEAAKKAGWKVEDKALSALAQYAKDDNQPEEIVTKLNNILKRSA